MNELSKPVGRETVGGPEMSGEVSMLLYIALLAIPVSAFLVILLIG